MHKDGLIEICDWLEPLLSDQELEAGIALECEARCHAHLIPTGDHWS